MKITSITSNLESKYQGKRAKQKNMVKSFFLDPGGTVDEAGGNFARCDIPERIIYITDQKFWKLSETDNVTFYSIRQDIAKLHAINKFNLLGCEKNNYGRNEIESMKREFGIQMIGINTTGKITDEKKFKSGESMDKEAIIKLVNAWRVHAQIDPQNKQKLGQIRFPNKKTSGLTKLINQLDSFIRVDAETVGSTSRPKFGAEGTQHDDGVTSMLGNVHLIVTKVLQYNYGQRSIAGKLRDDARGGYANNKPQLHGRTIHQVKQHVPSDNNAF